MSLIPSPGVWASKAVRQFPGISISKSEKKRRKTDLRCTKQSPGKGSPACGSYVVASRMARFPQVSGVPSSVGTEAPVQGGDSRDDSRSHQMLGQRKRWLPRHPVRPVSIHSSEISSGLWAGSHGWSPGCFHELFSFWTQHILLRRCIHTHIHKHSHTHIHVHTSYTPTHTHSSHRKRMPGPGLDVHPLEQIIFQ